MNAHPEDTPALVDWEQTLKQTAGNAKMAREMAKIYLGESASLLEKIRAALDAGEAKQLARACHTLKGASGYFGAAPVVKAAQSLESLGHSGDLSGAEPIFNELTGVVTRLAEELKPKTIE